jgi:betaine-aldehyde dehydrogenase
MVVERDAFFIDGRLVDPLGPGRLDVINPATETRVGSVPAATAEDIDAAVAAARHAFDLGPWPATPLEDRISILEGAVGYLEGSVDEISRLVTAEMGIPIATGTSRLIAGALTFSRSLAQNARLVSTEEVRVGTFPFYFRREPIGVIGAIVPWNAPFLLALMKISAALLMGSTVVCKPAAETPLDAYYIAEAFHAAGLPQGVLNLVPGGAIVGDYLVRHPGVDKISFTGSTTVGRRVGAACGELLKRCSLELGGKSSAIIMDDTDLESAVPMLSDGAFWNSGQICVATQRVLAPQQLYDEVVERMAQAATDLVVGDPFDPRTDIGPLVASRQRDRVENYLDQAKHQGAKLVAGGNRPTDHGWFIEPAVLKDVDSAMTIAQEETFGPVATIIPYSSLDQAVEIANDTSFGLGGAVFGADDDRSIAVAERIRTGTVTVNGYPLDAAATVGGRKSSGIGHEGGPEGLAEFTEVKMISLPSRIDSLDKLRGTAL